MPPMKFNTRIKYKGAIYNGLEPFEVEEADVAEMQMAGGVILEEPKPEEPPKAENEAPKPKGKKKPAGD